MKLKSIVAVSLGLAALMGCQPEDKPAVSLEQAKMITAQFQGHGFTPPPRTIADITAILDQQKPDPEKAEANRRAADAEPPTGLSAGDLSRFLHNRGTAAMELGRATQAVSDLRQEIGRAHV